MAIKVTVPMPAVVYVKEEQGVWENLRSGVVRRSRKTYRFHAEVPHATGAYGPESVGGFRSETAALAAGKKALRQWAAKLNDSVDPALY